MRTELLKWLAFGTGVGIEIRDRDLQVAITRVRPGRVQVLGSATVPRFRERPAAEWGVELLAFLRKLGCAHIAATVLLPRQEVIVRQLQLPGVAKKDLPSAIAFQIDSLHPFPEEEAIYAWDRIAGTATVLIGITRREALDFYAALFVEAGIKIASITFSAATLYSAARIPADGPARPANFLALLETGDGFEAYGESEARPVFSATLDLPRDKVVELAASELRLAADTEPVPVSELLPRPALFPPNYDPAAESYERNALPYAASLAAACPWFSISGNLLPSEQRRTSSRARLIPTAALGVALLGMVGALVAQSKYEDARYLDLVRREIQKVEPRARTVEALERAMTRTRARAHLLDQVKLRSKADLDALQEVTRLLPPPGWLSGMQLTRTSLQINGETEQAAELLKVIDGSPLFRNSEFGMPIARVASGDVFQIRTQREEPK